MKKGICFLFFDGEMIERKPFDSRYDMRKILSAYKKRITPFTVHIF